MKKNRLTTPRTLLADLLLNVICTHGKRMAQCRACVALLPDHLRRDLRAVQRGQAARG